jgi:hypothetical protein
MPYVIEALLIAIALVWEMVDFVKKMEAGDGDA